jgi:hypothetical protein
MCEKNNTNNNTREKFMLVNFLSLSLSLAMHQSYPTLSLVFLLDTPIVMDGWMNRWMAGLGQLAESSFYMAFFTVGFVLANWVQSKLLDFSTKYTYPIGLKIIAENNQSIYNR